MKHDMDIPVAPNPNRKWIFAGVVAVLIAGSVAAVAMLGKDEAPRLNDNTVALSKFVYSQSFDTLPFDQQRQYYKVMDDRDEQDQIKDAYEAKQINESEYRAALEAAWLGKHINRTEKYFALPAGQQRTAYINQLLDKKDKKDAKKKPGSAGGGGTSDQEDIDADETAAELKVEKWPANVRTQWNQFHEAYRAQRKARDADDKAATNPAR
jgi:hypothetical protein